MKKFILLLLIFASSMLIAQHLDTLDDELPIAPLRGGDEPRKPIAAPLPPPTLSPPPSIPAPAMPNNDIAKVVPTKCVKPKGKFAWNLDKAKLSDLVDQISRLKCINFIIASNVKPSQEISIISRTPITVEQAWQAFQSTLEANELSLFKTGNYYKIIKRGDSAKQPIPLIDGKETLPQDESMVTYLYDLKHLQKEMAQSLVKGLISRVGDLIIVGETFLVITDGSSNIRRIMNIIEKVDISGAANRIHIVDLLHADATQIQTKLNDIFASLSGKPGAKPAARSPYEDYPGPRAGAASDNFNLQKMIADERTNKLIVIASDRAFERIKEMIDVLDVPSSGAGTQAQIYVYYLKHGDAKKISTTLSTLVQGLKSKASSGGTGFARGDGMFEGEIKVTADEATNSLVSSASPRDYKALLQVISKLDKRRTQVYVEAAILEINLSDMNHFNLGAFGGVPFSIGGNQSTLLLANPAGKALAEKVMTSIGSAASTGPQGMAAAGLAPFLNTLGFIGPQQTLNFNGQDIKIPGMGAVLDILQTYSNADILATPSLMTLDNEKAEMSVGERVPTISGASAAGLLGGGGAGANLGSLLSQIKYEEPKLKFTLTPHVNDDNLVRLDIEQDVMSITGYMPLNNSSYPMFTTKTAKTFVTAQDQQTVVLGGMINESYTTTETKVPFLGDIPLLGHLFKKTEKTKIKKNLMLIITPYVVRTENDLRKIYERKSKEREDFGKLYFGDKITTFDPYVDYDKKSGPLARLVGQVGLEMQKTENGGPGLPGETLIKAPDKPLKEKHNDLILDTSIPEETDLDNDAQKPAQVPVTETVITSEPA